MLEIQIRITLILWSLLREVVTSEPGLTFRVAVTCTGIGVHRQSVPFLKSPWPPPSSQVPVPTFLGARVPSSAVPACSLVCSCAVFMLVLTVYGYLTGLLLSVWEQRHLLTVIPTLCCSFPLFFLHDCVRNTSMRSSPSSSVKCAATHCWVHCQTSSF